MCILYICIHFYIALGKEGSHSTSHNYNQQDIVTSLPGTVHFCTLPILERKSSDMEIILTGRMRYGRTFTMKDFL